MSGGGRWGRGRGGNGPSHEEEEAGSLGIIFQQNVEMQMCEPQKTRLLVLWLEKKEKNKIVSGVLYYIGVRKMETSVKFNWRFQRNQNN